MAKVRFKSDYNKITVVLGTIGWGLISLVMGLMDNSWQTGFYLFLFGVGLALVTTSMYRVVDPPHNLK